MLDPTLNARCLEILPFDTSQSKAPKGLNVGRVGSTQILCQRCMGDDRLWATEGY
jgi:hypothetical protein